MIKREELR
jgi:hypothetical protein